MVNPSKTKKRPLTVQEKNFKKLLHKLGHEIKLAKQFKEQADELHNKKSSRQSANLSINAAKNLKENQYALSIKLMIYVGFLRLPQVVFLFYKYWEY